MIVNKKTLRLPPRRELKTKFVCVRFAPSVLRAVIEQARREGRPRWNMLEQLIRRGLASS